MVHKRKHSLKFKILANKTMASKIKKQILQCGFFGQLTLYNGLPVFADICMIRTKEQQIQ